MRKAVKIDTLKIGDYTLIHDGLSQGLIQAFCQCPRKFLFRINKWRKKKGKPGTLFGTIVHDVSDAVYSSGDSSLDFIDKCIDEVLTREGQINDFGELQGAKAFAVLVAYCKYYASDQKDNKFGEPEEVFSVEFGTREIYAKRKGKIDGQFYPVKTDKLWLLEKKTMGRIYEDDLMIYLNMDFQSLFYVIAKEDISGESVKGVLYDVIRNPGLKLKKGESLLDYIDRISDDIQLRPEHYFMRLEVPFKESDKNYFVNEVQRKTKDIFFKIKACEKDTPYKVFYRNQSACRGAFTCDFLEACSTGCLQGYEQGDTIFPELEY